MKTRKFLTLAAAIVVIATTFSSCGYNGMVNREEAIDGKWAQVENQYQRRADLIPNLVETVKGAADFEKGTLESVIEARSNATSIKLDAKDLTQENLDKFQAAQDQLSGALSRLMVVVERYPELKATQAFQDLMVQLEGTENRISVERKNFNDAVMDYNSFIRRFPNNITASIFGFEKRAYFKAQEGADVAPKVDFGKKEE
ncbi:MAG: LemA family protein [Leadbetterella sp.]|nr:LemA family protein [Leadbetterella sp.]